ncbi:MAG: SDR family oxidoreductase [Myxococcales bacterium]|nr:MAG: SDR family oxidoreductase [Myxococcales bacterium]
MAGRLEGKVAVVTGAGSGIGRASALRFALEGAAVVVNDLDPEAAARVVSEIEGAGGRARAAPGDVTKSETAEALADAAVGAFGKLDVFHNNAGGAMPTPIEAMDLARWRRDLDLNLDSVWYGTRAALRIMLPQRRGCILTTSSGAGLGAVDGLSAYGAAKAAVINLMRSVALEYGQHGIRANTICPGTMDTPGLRAWLDTRPGRDRFANGIPLRRLGFPDEIANAALFLASDEASYVTGATLVVDGGISSSVAVPSSD